MHDHAPERRWRHLDAMKFKTYLTTRPPRIRCLEHGVVSVSLPWAGFSSRWTIDLECRVIEFNFPAKLRRKSVAVKSFPGYCT